MNVIKLQGGLGNQLFQYAFGKAQQANGIDVAFDHSWHELRKTKRKKTKWDLYPREYRLNKFNTTVPICKLTQEPIFDEGVDLKLLHKDGFDFVGYWSDLKYSEHILPLLRKEFCVKEQFYTREFLQLKEQIQKSEQAMKDYQTPPDNFKLSLDKVSHFTGSEIKESEHVKLAELNELVEQRTTFRNFHNSMENLKNVEVYAAENSFNKMAYDAKLMIANGESIGDIAKIAMRYVKEQGSDMKKIAAAYDIIHKDLIDSGFHVKTGFTKTSSMKINNSSKVLEPVLDFTLSIEKIAAIDDICKNVSKTLNLFDQVIDKRIK